MLKTHPPEALIRMHHDIGHDLEAFVEGLDRGVVDAEHS